MLIYQKILQEIAPHIKFNEAAILTYLVNLQESESPRVINQKVNNYSRIAYSKLIGDLPLLQVNQNSIRPILDKLTKYGLIDFKHLKDLKENTKKDNRVYFKTLPACEQLVKELNKKKKEPKKGYVKMLMDVGISELRAKVFATEVKFFQKNFPAITRTLSSSATSDEKLKWLEQTFVEWQEQEKAQNSTD